MADRHKYSENYKALTLEIWKIELLWYENLAFYKSTRNEIITLQLFQYESAVIQQGILL